jgi:triosephosphate isomerase
MSPRKKTRPKLVIANWKMAPLSAKDGAKIIATFNKQRAGKGAYVGWTPPSLMLAPLKAKFRAAEFGVQNVSAEREGAHTGEVSAVQAKAAGAGYAIVGHSERRAMGETDAQVAAKVRAVLEAGMQVLLCVGERDRDDAGRYLRTLAAQIVASLDGVDPKAAKMVAVAYEPIWAIGAGKSAIGPNDLLETARFVRKTLREVLGAEVGDKTYILYGGSVDGDNAAGLVTEGEVDGFLVGRASLDPFAFAAIVKACQQ